MNSVRVPKMTDLALIEELKTLVDAGKVLTDADSLEAYGKDWTKHFAPAQRLSSRKLLSKCKPLCAGLTSIRLH